MTRKSLISLASAWARASYLSPLDFALRHPDWWQSRNAPPFPRPGKTGAAAIKRAARKAKRTHPSPSMRGAGVGMRSHHA